MNYHPAFLTIFLMATTYLIIFTSNSMAVVSSQSITSDNKVLLMDSKPAVTSATSPASTVSTSAATSSTITNNLSTENKLTTEVSSDRLVDHIYANYFAFAHGPAINNPISNKITDVNGKENKVMDAYFDSTILFAYKLTKNIGIGPEINFLLEPEFKKNHGFTWNDSGIRIFNNHFIQAGTFNLYMNMILQAPTSESSRDRKEKYAVKTTPILFYTVPNTPWTLGAFTEAKAYVGVNKGKTFKLYAEPVVYYRLSDRFNLSLMYEYELHHLKGTPASKFVRVNSNLQPGFKWNVARNFWINPYLILYVNDKVTKENTSINASMSYTFL